MLYFLHYIKAAPGHVNSTPTLIALFFFLGLSASAQVLGYLVMAERNPVAIIGTTMSVAFLKFILVKHSLLLLFHNLLTLSTQSRLAVGLPMYYHGIFREAMCLLPAAALLSLLLAVFIRESAKDDLL